MSKVLLRKQRHEIRNVQARDKQAKRQRVMDFHLVKEYDEELVEAVKRKRAQEWKTLDKMRAQHLQRGKRLTKEADESYAKALNEYNAQVEAQLQKEALLLKWVQDLQFNKDLQSLRRDLDEQWKV